MAKKKHTRKKSTLTRPDGHPLPSDGKGAGNDGASGNFQKSKRASSRAEKPKPLYRRKPPERGSPDPQRSRNVGIAAAEDSRAPKHFPQRIPTTNGHASSSHPSTPLGEKAVADRMRGNAEPLHDTQLPFRTLASDAPIEAQPFLKWVGGKAQLLAQFDAFFPTEVTRYFEPFVGGGAVFFHLKHRFPKMKAFLRDINGELINAYRAVRDFPRELMRRLDHHAAEFKARGDDYFYYVRSQHDGVIQFTAETQRRGEGTKTELTKLTELENVGGNNSENPVNSVSNPHNHWKIVERAARMIFLNKTCFNGLWRVNASGKFNVLVGSNKNPNEL